LALDDLCHHLAVGIGQGGFDSFDEETHVLFLGFPAVRFFGGIFTAIIRMVLLCITSSDCPLSRRDTAIP